MVTLGFHLVYYNNNFRDIKSMANNNLVNSKVKMKDKIRLKRVDSSARDIAKLAKSARFVGLVDDVDVEADIDAEMSA